MGVIELSKDPDALLLSDADMVWDRPFALCGNGPNPLSLLSDRTLQNIDSQLRSSTPAFNGFDGLCAYLALPIRQRNLTSSFQVLAQLPAAFHLVGFEKHALEIYIECLGAPDLMVEWLPAHKLQRVPPDWISKPPSKHPTPTHYVSIAVPHYYAQAAKLILFFGELQAHAGTVALPIFGVHPKDGDPLLDLEEEPTVPDFATRELRNQEHPKLTYRSEIKRAILVLLTQNPRATDLEICRGLDADGVVELPDGWKKNREDRLFKEAYMDSKLRHKIEIQISKVRAEMRKLGIL
jgi:hypothetical protein